ncbi:TetR family transcriptional regulator C-terminal domain-containing protein [Nesterenkonia sp. LB17]|uniref:TetR/AcrR family transcriptional regulator n=1 Tax=unclassified Nesterenkonia TaxID=2629769 RepID=UPI001F4CD625|nr:MULTISPECIES: TetR family transcriptional regulator C-terminal domain-containing protein [unclassified Nesterenkonia]MCH8559141.1 TetR family transcriptional regulator C-terminal domain-containing protein [Nesterenkonia sp. DZ6]MCH8563055.1 TetR family transcriptional regulator C-terminal domain-containing protein [Nesterenkonia sp. YGD6]MCH8565129.1 TetR family transcriptional regulator C-terminal domain-containing protein [Nesterenkonia sp. LB17]
MPKKIDREDRRQQIVRTYLRIADRDGLEAATSRAVATELGVSTGSLWHYFSGFDDVVFRAFTLIFERTNTRITEGVGCHSGLRALMALLEEVLPVGEETEREALIVTNFWGRASSKPALGQFQTEVGVKWRQQITDHLSEAIDAGELTAAAPVEEIADVLMVLITGLQVECALRTPLADTQRQWRTVRHCLSSWLTQAGRAAVEL